jgi:hypothetical protein
MVRSTTPDIKAHEPGNAAVGQRWCRAPQVLPFSEASALKLCNIVV